MSIFAKKPEAKWDVEPEVSRPQATGEGGRPYGIADAIRLMRSLPVDQNVELVIRVVRVTLGSLDVRVEDIIEDASRKQKTIQDNIAALQTHVADLEEQLEARQREITAFEADLKETTSVKERLQLAERSAAQFPLPGPGVGSSSVFGLPPPITSVRNQAGKMSDREASGHNKGG
jgi:acyl-CoA hydrolase